MSSPAAISINTLGDCLLPGAKKDKQSISSEWEFLREPIAGVALKHVRNVAKGNGLVTEIYRRDWQLDDLPVDQVFQNLMLPGGITGWHVHRFTTDRIFVNHGLMRIVLFDARKGSSTQGQIDEYCLGLERPALVLVPPGVWHAVENLANEPSLLLNLVDRAYDYENPDHYRLPIDTPEIPYQFARR